MHILDVKHLIKHRSDKLLKFNVLILMLSLIAYIPTSFASAITAEEQVLKVVNEMNSAWLEQDLSRCISYFTLDTQFENSYGWSIANRESLKHFLQGFLFAKYPKIEQKYVHTGSTVEFLTADIALVEEAKRIDSQDSQSPPRWVRTNFLLKQIDGQWLIWKTHSWTPKSHDAPPTDFVVPNKYPQIFN
jgi:uncharacterized protein (TIGR02246 family)